LSCSARLHTSAPMLSLSMQPRTTSTVYGTWGGCVHAMRARVCVRRRRGQSGAWRQVWPNHSCVCTQRACFRNQPMRTHIRPHTHAGHTFASSSLVSKRSLMNCAACSSCVHAYMGDNVRRRVCVCVCVFVCVCASVCV
jgi:hypothetical protein